MLVLRETVIRLSRCRLCHDVLPSRETLLRRGLQLDPICPTYLTDSEDTNHVFFYCPVTMKIWDLIVAH